MSSNPNTTLVADFVRWWTRRGDVAAAELFAPNVRYQQAFPSMSGDAGMRLIEQSPAWEEFVIESEVHEGDCAAVQAQGTDSVTGLRHRISWWMRFEAGRIAEVSEIVQPGVVAQ